MLYKKKESKHAAACPSFVCSLLSFWVVSVFGATFFPRRARFSVERGIIGEEVSTHIYMVQQYLYIILKCIIFIYKPIHIYLCSLCLYIKRKVYIYICMGRCLCFAPLLDTQRSPKKV